MAHSKLCEVVDRRPAALSYKERGVFLLSCSPVCWPRQLEGGGGPTPAAHADVSLRGGRAVGWRSRPQTPAG